MKNRKGLTLIEVIVSMAIVGVIAVVILSIFSSGTKNIARAGHRTTNIYDANRIIDELIIKSENPYTDWDAIESENENIVVNNMEYNVILPGIGEDIKVSGKLLKVTSTDEENNTIIIETFVPNKLESGEVEGS
ncbi:MAG: type II secretion system protein [Tissierellaceae bacterium]|nr:type II secretion system protein [Tissierellaceae bacterium]